MAFHLVDELAAAGVDKTVAEEIAKNPVASAKLQEKFENGLRQSDYDRFMNSKKAEFAAQSKTLQEQLDAFENQKKVINDQYMSALTTREQAEAQLATLRAKAKTVSDVYGVDMVKELFGEGTTAPAQQPRREEPTAGLSKDLEQRLSAIEDLFKTNVNFEVELHDIARQHIELFPDKPLVMKELLDDAVKQRRSPTQVWDDKFGASAKREEIKADRYRAEGAAKAKEDLEKKYSGQMVNGMRTDLPTSPLFGLKPPGTQTPKDRQQSSNDTVANAVAAFTSGKYRQNRAGPEH